MNPGNSGIFATMIVINRDRAACTCHTIVTTITPQEGST